VLWWSEWKKQGGFDLKCKQLQQPGSTNRGESRGSEAVLPLQIFGLAAKLLAARRATFTRLRDDF